MNDVRRDMGEKKEPEIEIIDRTEGENGDYSFTFVMRFEPGDDDDE